MRFMIIVKTDEHTEGGATPTSEDIAAMGRFNDELIKAGILLAAEGLHPSNEGARVKFADGKFTVKDGPFAEAKELVGGFWIIQVKDKEEALAWVKRIPFAEGQEIELRRVFEASDFPVDMVSQEHLAKEQAWREANQKPLTR